MQQGGVQRGAGPSLVCSALTHCPRGTSATVAGIGESARMGRCSGCTVAHWIGHLGLDTLAHSSAPLPACSCGGDDQLVVWLPLPWPPASLAAPAGSPSVAGGVAGGGLLLVLDAVSTVAVAGFVWVGLLVVGLVALLVVVVFWLSQYW